MNPCAGNMKKREGPGGPVLLGGAPLEYKPISSNKSVKVDAAAFEKALQQ